jgi:hypothetical protein
MRTNFRGCRLVLRRRDAKFDLRQDSRSVSKLAIRVSDNLPQRMLGGFGSLLRQLQTFRGAPAHGVSTSFDFSRILLDAVENLGGLINQVERVSANRLCRGTLKAQYVPANGRPFFSASHEKDLCWNMMLL